MLLRLLDTLPVPLGELVQQRLWDKMPNISRPERCINLLVKAALGRLGHHLDDDNKANDHKEESHTRIHTFLFAKAKKMNVLGLMSLFHSSP